MTSPGSESHRELTLRHAVTDRPEALAAAIAALDGLAPDDPRRHAYASYVATAWLQVGGPRDLEQFDRFCDLADVAAQDPANPLDWNRLRTTTGLTVAHGLFHAGSRAAEFRAIETILDRLHRWDTGDEEIGRIAARLGIQVALARSREAGDIASLTDLPGRIAELDPPIAVDPAIRRMRAHAQGAAMLATGSFDDNRAQIPILQAAIRDVRPEHGTTYADMVAALHTVSDFAFGPDRDPAPAFAAIGYLRGLAKGRGFDADIRAAMLVALGSVEVTLARRLPSMWPGAILDIRRGVRRCSPDNRERPVYLAQLGSALLGRAEAVSRTTGWSRLVARPSIRPARGGRADLAEAISALREALRLAGSPGHRAWASASVTLGRAHRLAGDNAASREAGRDGLRGHAWRVLLQSRTAAATAGARFAADDAVEVAGWCVEDGDAEGAAYALEAGRALILHAATEINDVPTRLAAAGAEDLAARWAAAGGPETAPTELRAEVIRRLADRAGLLDPPDLDTVRAALVTVGADALVYLLEGTAAVIVDAAGPVRVLDLPDLWMPEPARGALDAGEVRDLAPEPSARRTELEALCDWAWPAAIGPLLEALPAHPDRPPRIVLVPIGELARVPWHAARRAAAGRYEYAVERAVFSYAASARALCRVAAGPDTPVRGDALIVGDPDTGGRAADLRAARREAVAVHRTYHPGSRYVGRWADGTPSAAGAGTAGDVLDWLADESAAGGRVLHLACHGIVAGGTDAADTSYLVLAGGERLAAERLIATMSTHPARRVRLVVLAACRSAVSGRGWDEAFSLSTAFLASGAGSVVATHWSVPDGPTSMLMVLLHHYLRREGRPVADALRDAQLWMLGVHRDRPEGVPDLAAPSPEVLDWAGFAHYGR